MSTPPPVGSDVLAEAVELARAAGRSTLRWFRSRDLDVHTKDDGTPVTLADREAERLVRDELARRYPDDGVVGEEEPKRSGTSGRTWTVDPIDGTKAFTRGVPLYSTLLALEDDAGPALGVIDLPALGETVWAGRGRGCFCNDEAVTVGAVRRLGGAYVMTSAVDHWPPGALDRLQGEGAVVRTWGDGYGYALVATGRVDAMIDPAAAPWDLAAMPVILAEAGGRFTDLQGRPGAGGGSGLGTNGHLHEAILALLAPP